MAPGIQRQSAPELLTTLLERLAFEVRRTRQIRDPESVHDLRVAIRRFAQAIEVFRPCFNTKHPKKIRRRLRNMIELAGVVRDCDISMAYLSKLRVPVPEALVAEFHSRRKNVNTRYSR